jgi:hypothetical protein
LMAMPTKLIQWPSLSFYMHKSLYITSQVFTMYF